MVLNIVFGVLALASLFFSLFFLLRIMRFYKKYEGVSSRIVDMKRNNNSRHFIKEQLLSEGFEEALVEAVLEDLFL